MSSERRPIVAGESSEPVTIREDRADAWLDVTHRMSQGDRDAFRHYYDHFFGLMLAESRRCTGRDEQTCLDIVHDAMLKAIRGMKSFPNERSLIVWTRMLVKSVSYDWLRREQRRRTLTNTSNDPVDAATTESIQYTAVIEHEARLIWLDDQLRQLPMELQRMFAWRYRLGWTLRQIGNRLGLKPGAVDGRLRRAIEELKTLAERNSDD